MKAHWSFLVPMLGVLSLLAAAAHAQNTTGQPTTASSIPVVALFPGNALPVGFAQVANGTTQVGTLNQLGLGVFDMRNNTGGPIKTVVVAVDLGAPAEAGKFGCSQVTTLLLSTCTVQARGNVLYVMFSGAPEIMRDAHFRVGFSAPGGSGWPPSRPVSVIVNGQIPS